jgi:adenine phosphoribosyltransferase
MTNLSDYIRNIPDFPKKGINFKDVTTLFKDPTAFRYTVDQLYERYKDLHIEKVAGIESRGFILGSALAARLGCGFIPIRKKGKLPAQTIQQEYSLEYGTDIIEIHKDAIQSKERVLLHDDLLATGGTMSAAIQLVEKMSGTIAGISFLIELSFLNGRVKLTPYDVYSLIIYNQE